MIELFNLPYKMITHFKVLGFQGGLLLFKRYIKGFSNFRILLPKYRFPIILRNNSTDTNVFYQVFLEKSYQIKTNFKPKVIIDCGANIGLASVFFKNRYPEATIIAIEPEESNFKMLKANTNTNMYHNIHCLKKGVWNKSANLIVNDNGYGNWGFTVDEVEYENSNTIAAISINEIMSKFNLQHIDILKIDIEGSEKELFLENFENWLSKTKILIIELHDGLNSGASKSFFSAISGYEFYMLRKNENLIFFFD